MGRKKTTPGEKQSKTKQAKKRFEAWYHVGATAVSKDGKQTLIVKEGERFKQYPKRKTQYISNIGHVVSFVNETPIFRTATPSRKYFRYSDDWAHLMQAEAFADEIEVYGKGNEPDGELHHMRQATEENNSLEYLNNIDYEEKVSGNVHSFLTSLQTHPLEERTEADHFNIMQELGTLAEAEEPEKATIVIDDGARLTSIHAIDIPDTLKKLQFTSLESNKWYCLKKCNDDATGRKLKEILADEEKSVALENKLIMIANQFNIYSFNYIHNGLDLDVFIFYQP